MHDDFGCGYVEPYEFDDPRNEPRPDCVIYLPIFERPKASMDEAVSVLQKPLQESTYRNPTIEALKREVQNRTKENTQEQIAFAVAGDMNSGKNGSNVLRKSSVINSVLSIGIIARKGDAGGSCTWVVQRFMKMFPDQRSPYAAKVHFFNSKQIRDIIASLFARYYRASGKDRDGSDEGEDHGVEDYGEVRSVLDAFMALFCDHAAFETQEATKAFLGKADAEDDRDMLEMLTAWAHDVVSQRLQGEGREFVTVHANTPEELLFKLQPYTYTLGGDDGKGVVSLWPLVSVIDFGFKHPLLELGIVLVDTSGRSDANFTRSRNAALWQQKCPYKIIVAEIARAKDDKSLREGLALAYRTRGSGHALLAVTKGDQIDVDANVYGSPLDNKRQQKLKDEATALDNKKTQLSQQRQQRQQKTEVGDRWAEEEKIREVAANLRSKVEELAGLRMAMCNRSVLHTVRQQYKELTGDPYPLPAFVVGNEAYKKHQAGYTMDDKPAMGVEDTQIPSLRRRIYLLPAEGKLKEALHLAEVQLPSLVNSFQLFCSKTHMARKHEIEAILLQPKSELSGILQNIFEELRAEAQSCVLALMRKNETRWISGARKLCKVWKENNQAGQLALLREHGYKKGTKRGGPDINYNLALMSIESEALLAYLGNMQNAILPIISDLDNSIACMIDNTRTKIRDDPQSNLMVLEPFLDGFSIEKLALKQLIDRAGRDLRKDISIITENLVSFSPDAYFCQAMVPIYAQVCQIKGGRGAPQRRAELFASKVSRVSGVWLDVHDLVERALNKLFVQHLGKLSEDIDQVIDGIHDKFNLLCEDTAAKSQEEKEQELELRAQLQRSVIKANELIAGPVRQAAEECKNYGSKKEQESLFVEP